MTASLFPTKRNQACAPSIFQISKIYVDSPILFFAYIDTVSICLGNTHTHAKLSTNLDYTSCYILFINRYLLKNYLRGG